MRKGALGIIGNLINSSKTMEIAENMDNWTKRNTLLLFTKHPSKCVFEYNIFYTMYV